MAYEQDLAQGLAKLGICPDTPAELRPSLRVEGSQLAVENLDLETEPGPCPFEYPGRVQKTTLYLVLVT